MSFLSSVLSSIGGDRPMSATQPANPAPTVTASSSSSLKRKADDMVRETNPKITRNEYISQASSANKFASRVDRLSASSVPTSPSSSVVKARQLPPKPALSGSTNPSKPLLASSSVGTTPKQPAKGSFREVLARAQAAKAAQSQIGQIKHKSVTKMTRKERIAKEAEASRQGKLNTKSKTPASNLKGANVKAKLSGGGAEKEKEKEKKKPLDLGYKGTMRSAVSTMSRKDTTRPIERPKPLAKAQPQPQRGSEYGPVGPRYTYASYSDEEDEDEDEDDYESDDMEAAGFDELEDEEEASLRYAKKEDLQALKEENEHKRQKEERRQKLLQLAAKRRR